MIKKRIYKRFLNLFKKKKKISQKILGENNKDKFEIINTHKNNIFLIYFSKKKFFRKFSTDKNGVGKIKSELEGIKWYCKIRKIKSNTIIRNYKKQNNFAFLDLKKIEGIKIKSWENLEITYPYLIKVFKHFHNLKLLAKSEKIHGDLTLDNIIFCKRKLFIIDWELFHSKKNFPGYDIAYLFLSAACLPYIVGKKFTLKDEFFFQRLWKLLIKKKYNKNMLSDPFMFFQKNIRKKNILRKSMEISKSKFFPLITPKNHKDKILKIINKIKI